MSQLQRGRKKSWTGTHVDASGAWVHCQSCSVRRSVKHTRNVTAPLLDRRWPQLGIKSLMWTQGNLYHSGCDGLFGDLTDANGKWTILLFTDGLRHRMGTKTLKKSWQPLCCGGPMRSLPQRWRGYVFILRTFINNDSNHTKRNY